MKVVGHVTRRRCIGKNLTFADIQVEASDSETFVNEKIQVVFQRDSPSWNIELDDNFPSKNSKLPYGAKVDLKICERQTERGSSLEVKSWEMLSNPRDEAIQKARHVGGSGISCSLYLKARGENFLKYNKTPSNEDVPKPDETSISKDANDNEFKPLEEQKEFSHGDNRAKSMRAKVFSSFLIETYGVDRLKANRGILDVAGGKGRLSIELALSGIQCTIVDPLVRKHGKTLDKKGAKMIQKAGKPHPELVSTFFNTTTFAQEHQDLIEGASIFVGLHPDEPTEDILDLALAFNKPLAIVPCCVFPGFFPLRKLPCGTPVRTYEQFLQYLLAKDSRLQIACLPFEGRNQVIFLQE